MASVRNAFDLLASSGSDQASTLAKKKKGKKKGSDGTAAPVAAAPIAAPAPTTAAVSQPAPPPQPARSAKEAGEALKAEGVAAATGERGLLASEWTEQVHASWVGRLGAACASAGPGTLPVARVFRLRLRA